MMFSTVYEIWSVLEHDATRGHRRDVSDSGTDIPSSARTSRLEVAVARTCFRCLDLVCFVGPNQCSVDVVDGAAKQRLRLNKESCKAYIEEWLPLRKRRKEIHQARLWRHGAAFEWCWY